MELVKQLEYATSQEAWEQINEMFATYDPKLFSYGCGFTGGFANTYKVILFIRKAWIDPEFDYGKMFGYRIQKWSLLINNYLNLNKLDLLRSRIRLMRKKNMKNYHLSFSFDNNHSSGKGCLLAAIFSQRVDMDVPTITMILRSSEITKRLIFDFLLIQRMGEYVYGKEQTFSIEVIANQMYCNAETVIMYDTHKPLKKLLKKATTKWAKTVEKTLEEFKTCEDPKSKYGSYKVYLRTARQLRPEKFKGHYRPLIAKNLILEYDEDIPYPEDCISFSQRNRFKKRYLKNNKK